MSRRAVLGTAAATLGGVGVAGVAAQRAGVLDDGLRALGLRPHAEPNPRDVQLLAEAAGGQRALLSHFDALVHKHQVEAITPLRPVLAEQLAAVADESGGSLGTSPISDDQEEALRAFADLVETTAGARHEGALASGSLAVTQVLASMAAGLGQVEVAVRGAL
jgi:hypothetical protein